MQRYTCANGSQLRLDTARDLIWVSFPERPAGQEYFLEDAAAVARHFDEMVEHLRAIGRPQATLVVDYANFDINPVANQAYVDGLRRITPLVSGAVRHSCNIVQASLLRANNVQAVSGAPQIVATKAEALVLVGALCRVPVGALAR